ncbi:MAG: AAR2 pre-mRNA splicing protein [Ardenticatenaceae bacterium]|nr:AAR2 pre-mRNA splicing protein [Ardenticatenaceae bacterium]
MFGAIILLDVPKKEARIGTAHYAIQGGFRGFGMVPPAAWHYVSVQADLDHVGFWCYLQPKEVVVKVFNDEAQRFEDAAADVLARYANLALSGAMSSALITYPHANFGPWYGLVQHIPSVDFPPPLHVEDSGTGSRFAKAFQGTHGGDANAFLAEFQYAFVNWYVTQASASSDEAAFARWRHLLLAVYNAGESSIGEAGDLLPRLVDTLLRQFDLLGDEWFAPDGFLAGAQAGYLVEDMTDTGVPDLVEKGAQLSAYIQKRQSRL